MEFAPFGLWKLKSKNAKLKIKNGICVLRTNLLTASPETNSITVSRLSMGTNDRGVFQR